MRNRLFVFGHSNIDHITILQPILHRYPSLTGLSTSTYSKLTCIQTILIIYACSYLSPMDHFIISVLYPITRTIQYGHFYIIFRSNSPASHFGKIAQQTISVSQLIKVYQDASATYIFMIIQTRSSLRYPIITL